MKDAEDRLGEVDLGDRASLTDYRGVASAYILTPDDQEHVVLQLAYAFEFFTGPSYQTRAFRQDRRLRGKKNKALPDCALKDEMIVVPGAGMTPEDVISTLLKMARAIQLEGLNIGSTKKDHFCAERIGKLPRFVELDRLEVAIEDT